MFGRMLIDSHCHLDFPDFAADRDAVIARAAGNMRLKYPHLTIVGYRNGYFSAAEESQVVAEINAARPDILWVGMGVPAEQLGDSTGRIEHLTEVG